MPGGQLQQRASQLVSEFTGQDADLGSRVLVDFLITGKPGNPQIKPKFAGTADGDGGGGQQPLKQAKDKLKEEKQKARERLEKEKQKARKKAEQKKKKARERAKKEKEKAKQKAKDKKEEAKEKAEDKIKDIFK